MDDALRRIADALERLAPRPVEAPDFHAAEAFIWHSGGSQGAQPAGLQPVPKVNRVPLALLTGIAAQRDQLLANTRSFAHGHPANNALLWGARGMGKSSLVKAVHSACVDEMAGRGATPGLKLIEIHREDIASLPQCLALLRDSAHRFIVYCDDLSFDAGETSYKSLKAVLEGGIEGRPDNVVFYATSNRRHLLPRDMIENESATAINPGDAVQEKVSLSDRFGLWIGFHNCDQADYLAMVRAYAAHHGLAIAADALDAEALAWSRARGSRSGRVASQFILDLAGRLGQPLRIER